MSEQHPGPPPESGDGPPQPRPGDAPPPQPPPPPPGNAGPPPQYGQQYPLPYPQPPMSPADERLWGGAAHWGALVASMVAMAFLGPLLVLLAKGNQSPFVRRQAVESLNFQLTVLIYGLISLVLCLVLIGFLLLIALAVLWLVTTIIGAIRANNGEDYRYPLNIRMVH